MFQSLALIRRGNRIGVAAATRRALQALAFAFAALVAAPAFATPFVVAEGATDLGDANAGDCSCADTNGKCSLRAAIEEANACPNGPHTITFTALTVNVINGNLPAFTAPVIVTGPAAINGQGGVNKQGCLSFSDAQTANFAEGATNSQVSLLDISNCNGDAISANGHGYKFLGNSLHDNTGAGISLSSSRTYGNFVDSAALDSIFQNFPAFPVTGTDVNNFAQQLATVLVTLNPSTISGNVIFDNGGDGVWLFSENLGAVFVSGNFIGTDPTGDIAAGNTGAGVRLSGFTFGNMIGPDNVIADNADGIRDESPKVYLPNFIMGNRIGLPSISDNVHIGNHGSGIVTSTQPDDSLTNKNPTGLSLVIGPLNFISDNQGAPNSNDPDFLTTDGAGVYITGTSKGVKVIGNTIGMAEIPAGTPLQTTAFGNYADGVIITSTGNTVQDNVIAGNRRHGVVVQGNSTASNHLLGNSIGVYPEFANDLTLGNGFDGVHIDAASSTDIGGPNGGDGNTIAANGRNGIALRHGAAGNGWSNAAQRNLIFGNAVGNPNAQPVALPPGSGVGIDLDHVENAADGPHDEFIGSAYANLDQAPPVICTGAGGDPAACAGYTAASAASGTTTLDWTVKTHGPADFRADFYRIDSADDNTATTMTFLGEQNFSTDAGGLPTGAGCSAGRCTSTLMMDASGKYVLMTVTDVTALTNVPPNTGDWKDQLICFIGDLGVILDACPVNDTSEFSNTAGVPLNSNAALSNLAISDGTLTPAFASNTLDYTDSVPNGTTSVTVTPTTADTSASVTVNGNTVTSGQASGAISLNVGDNVITVVVTAQDLTTTQTYTITVNRAGLLSNNADLSALAISAGTLSPSFAANQLDYTDAVPNATTSVTVTPTTADGNASVTVNGNTVTSGQASGAINLNVGDNVITIVVTAEDNTTTKTYTVTVNRAGAASNNADLSALAISAGTLSPSFASNTLDYTDAVSNATTSVTVTPTTADANATVTVNGSTVASGQASGAINLAVGDNAITVVVTAQDLTTTKTYTVTVNRAGALGNNADLSALAISAGTLTPAFASGTLAYTDSVGNGTASVTVTPTTADGNATVTVDGNAVTSGQASGAINLNVGDNVINVVVTAQDLTTTKTYTITVNRAGALSNDASLADLAISAGTLTPVFASATLDYTDPVSNATTSVTVTPTTTNGNATVTVNGNAVTSGQASGAINLAVGSNVITIIVTAQDATTTRTYTIDVNRAGALSNNASLAALTISAGTLTPAFASGTLGYTDAVSNATTSVTVTPTTADANATLTINGNAATSGIASGAIALNVGANPITIIVTAQDGTTTHTYTITVTRAASSNASLSGLAISAGALTPAFAGATLDYTAVVSNATTSLTVTPTTADATATVTFNGNAVTSGSPSGAINLAVGDNVVTVVVTAQDGTTTTTYTITVTRAAAVQTQVAGTSFTGTGTITATISGGGAGCGFGSYAFVGPPVAAPAGVNFPDGLFQFTATGCTGTVTVTAVFPTAFVAGEKYWKYGPTPGPVAAHWYTLGAANSVSLVGNTATFTITDGGLGDDDLSANNSITDAGGPAPPVQGGNGNGNVTPLPILSAPMLALLAALLALLGAATRGSLRVRRQRD
jgi:tRNA threonylcarbamoyladenosine modification (KEOPS) complex  Pcc1 subunit